MESLADISVWIVAALSAFLTGLLKKGLRFVDQSLVSATGGVAAVDAAWLKAVKAFMPAIVAVFAILLPMLANAIGVVDIPAAEAVANAPAATVLAVIFRELIARFVKPMLAAGGL